MENAVNEQHQHQHHSNNNINGRGHNGNNSNYSWDFWELGSTSWTNNNNNTHNSFSEEEEEENTRRTTAHALMFCNSVNDAHPGHSTHLHPHHHHHHQQQQNLNLQPYHHHHFHHGLYAGGTNNLHPDPHLTCLKLGKRHYFEDGSNGGPVLLGERHVDGFQIGKRGRSYDGVGVSAGVVFGGGGPSSSSSSITTSSVLGVGVGIGSSSSMVAVPRCQVEGCHVALVHAKDYHRRHKVCEMHSKAPRVTVLGIEQRFCQQCSRFHVISEFDDSKRSCRRRLAGHNERRRKSSNDSISRNPSQETRSAERFSFISPATGRALSLLSSKSASWVSPADLSTRSSAALRELIAENRAAALARQLFLDQNWHQHGMDNSSQESQVEILSQVPLQHQFPEPSEWDRFQESDAHVTLDLMQTPSSPFGFLSGRSKSKEEEEDQCCEIWKSLEGTHVV